MNPVLCGDISQNIPLFYIHENVFGSLYRKTTFIDILLGQKPRLYISYRITGENDFSDVSRFITKLSPYFVCINPFSIKDWGLVTKYDSFLEVSAKAEVMDIEIEYQDGRKKFTDFPVREIASAIDQIRTQIVQRDLQIITCTHATVIYHNSAEPSYGVMNELIHSVTNVSHPVYVIYPFKKRLSPFFEHYILVNKNLITGNSDIKALEDKALEMMLEDYPNWPTWSSVT
ncbi:MAG: hypothetical protein E4H21_11410 [Thermodesulfobacteriales bacterium]|nr:MAG: hypothetical protein E4H21_11410 [Thermodesulfobacteriales bacterium]